MTETRRGALLVSRRVWVVSLGALVLMLGFTDTRGYCRAQTFVDEKYGVVLETPGGLVPERRTDPLPACVLFNRPTFSTWVFNRTTYQAHRHALIWERSGGGGYGVGANFEKN